MTNPLVSTQPAAEAAARKMLAYCQSNEWAGIDPYDALNSRIFQMLPFLDRRIPRLVMTQALKRSPFNIRSLMLIPPTQNSKAFGIFLRSSLKFAKLGWPGADDLVRFFIRKLDEMRSPDMPYWCWGYSFPWQTRTLIVPRGTPNLVCTTFVADALLDAYEQTGDAQCLKMAASGAEYIFKDLMWTDGGSVAGFGYPLKTMRHNIHNGNLLGAALFCRVAKHTGDKTLIEPALKVARFSASKQHEDGSWDYGEMPTQKWIDNFHTGYNLEALQSMARSLKTDEFDARIKKGFEFYREHFFLEDGTAKYFHNKTHPIDIHCVAQSIMSLLAFPEQDGPRNEAMSAKVLGWALENMWSDDGYFFYRVLPWCKIRTSYMRWSQSWMLLALATFLEAAAKKTNQPDRKMVAAAK